MSVTKSMLRGMGLSEEQVSAIIEGHMDSVKALQADIEDKDKKLAALQNVQKELDDLKKNGGSWEEKYNAEHKAFEAYKADQDAKNTKALKKDAYKALLKEANVSDARIDAVLRVTNLDELELKDGKFTNAAELSEAIKKEWADFITQSSTRGASTQNPAKNAGGVTMDKKEIYKKDARGRYVMSASERQKALIEIDNKEN